MTRINAVPFIRNVGFTGDNLVTAVAIAYAESGCNPDVYFAEASFFEKRGYTHPADTGQGSTGLFQIFAFEHPEFAGWNSRDPQVNCCEMAMIWYRAGRVFTPWSTFRVPPPAYLKHVDQAKADIAAILQTPNVHAVSSGL